MKYSRKHSFISSVLLAVSSIALTALPSLSETGAHGGKQTDYGDGIKMVESLDHSGFVITTEDGTSLTFTAKNQQVVFAQQNGVKKVISFSDLPAQRIAKIDTTLIVHAQ